MAKRNIEAPLTPALSPHEARGQTSALPLRPAECEVLAEEIEAFARSLRDPEARDRYAQLRESVQQGTVAQDLVPALEALLELVLQTQRVRRLHGPEAEQALLRLFHRTPRGAALRQAASEVNQALQALRGQVLEALSFSPTPGGHSLVVDTRGCRLTLAIDRAGIRIESMELVG